MKREITLDLLFQAAGNSQAVSLGKLDHMQRQGSVTPGGVRVGDGKDTPYRGQAQAKRQLAVQTARDHFARDAPRLSRMGVIIAHECFDGR